MKLEIIQEEPTTLVHPTPILFVHGMWHAAWCWAEHFLPYFARHGYVSYALSLRGHGHSQGRERLRWTTLADYVSDVEQIAGQMPRPPVLVGHSMGGMVVQHYLASHTAPAAVLLGSAPPRGTFAATLRFVRRQPLAAVKAGLTMRMFPVVGTPVLAREALFSASMPAEQIEGYFARLQDESFRAHLDLMGLGLPRPERVKSPLLVLGAAADNFISPAEVEATARAYGTEAEFFPDMAHDMMLEQGWPAVADRILAWLKDQKL